MNEVHNYNLIQPNHNWETIQKESSRDLRIKKVVFTIIAVLNLAGIVGLLTFISTHYHLPTIMGSPFITPLIGGVVSALVLLKVPTLGITMDTYQTITNIPLMLAKVMTLALFAPAVIARNVMDWHDYGDPREAAKIKHDFEQGDAIDILEKYGPRIDNLLKYGYIRSVSMNATPEEIVEDFKALFESSKADIKAFRLEQRLNKEAQVEVHNDELRGALGEHRAAWLQLKVSLSIPNPPPPGRPTMTCGDRWFSCVQFIERPAPAQAAGADQAQGAGRPRQ